MKTNVPLFDQDGNEIGSEEIEIIEIDEYREHIDSLSTITRVEVICSDKVEKDTIIATLDEIYGYFNYKII